MAQGDAEAVITQYEAAKTQRSPLESDWRLAAQFCLPSDYASWQSDGPISTNQNQAAVRRLNFDTTGARSVPKYASVLERLATPSGQKWHTLRPSDPSLRRKRRVREYFDTLTDLLFQYRYRPAARFRTSVSEMYTDLGVYGNGPLFVGKRNATRADPKMGLKYISCPVKDCFVLADDDGNITGFFRRFWLNVRQFELKFPELPYPVAMQNEAKKATPSETEYYEFVHFVSVRGEDFDPSALDARRHPYSSVYVCCKSKDFVGDESGFQGMPYLFPRTATISGQPYGYSPAITALPSLGGASAIKKTNLAQGNRAANPTLLAHDDNVMNGAVDLRPGAVNYGGVNRDGKELIKPLVTGNFRVGEALLADERGDIEDTFFVTLFQILTETPEMTATEVMERVAEKAALLSPTMGRLQSEFLGPDIEREISVLGELGILPELPPELVEAEGEYETVYVSPLAKSLYAEHIGGFMRTVNMAVEISTATQDPSPLDHFDFEEALPEIADYLAVPARWMRSDDEIKKARETRQQASDTSELMKNAPGLASAAQAVAGT